MAEQPANFIGARIEEKVKTTLGEKKEGKENGQKLAGGWRKAAGPVRGPLEARGCARADTRVGHRKENVATRWHDTMSIIYCI